MTAAPLTLRKTQISLLDSACASGAAAEVRIRHRPRAETGVRTRFVQLARDGLLLEAPSVPHAATAMQGPLEVTFQLGQERYCFVGHSRGVTRESARANPLWKLSIPLWIERHEDRDCPRVDLTGGEPIVAQLVLSRDPAITLPITLTNISAGGLAGRITAGNHTTLECGDVCWISVRLPENSEALDFVVRLTHVRPVADGAGVDTGWNFCGGDDRSRQRRALKQIEDFVGRKGPVRPRGATSNNLRGHRQC